MANDGFDFCVSLSAEDWANTKRRMAFLEAILTQVMRDHTQIREWFTAQEIAALKLPSLSHSTEGIARKAVHHKWRRKQVKIDGRMIYTYHYTSLPNTAFEAFIARLIDMPDFEALDIPDYQPPEKPSPEPTPQWMLPLMRLIKGNRVKTWQEAYTILTIEQSASIDAKEIENAFGLIYKRARG